MTNVTAMLDSAGNPLSVGMSVLWKGHGCRDFRVGWVRDISLFGGKPAARIDDGAEWDTDLTGRTWSATEWITEPKRIRPRRDQPKADPRIAELTAEVERLREALTEARRPSEAAARERIRRFLEREIDRDDYPLHLVPDGDSDSAPGKCGWAFWLLDGDPTSYVGEGLEIEWYGTGWEGEP